MDFTQIEKNISEMYYEADYTSPEFIILDRSREYYDQNDSEKGSILNVIVEDSTTKKTYCFWSDSHDESNCGYDEVIKIIVETVTWQIKD